MNTRILQAIVGLVIVFAPRIVHAAPLSNFQLNVFQDYEHCTELCTYGKVAVQTKCLTACAKAADDQSANRSDWDKNRDGKVDRIDFDLAVLENRDAGAGILICYESQAVVPKNACGLSNCIATRKNMSCNDACAAAQCADQDNDGVRRYQEDLIGTSDQVADSTCLANSDCGGYQRDCRWVSDVDKQLCMKRMCGGSPCTTAFSLVPVVQDNNEVLVNVNYDYSPTPATVLDLRVIFSRPDLTLVDARPTNLLGEAHKTLSAQQSPAGYVRLVVLSDITLNSANTLPIPFGTIAQLLFKRTSTNDSQIYFSKDDDVQVASMAPDPGQYKAGLKDDNLWGATVSVTKADAKNPRLMLYYSFDSSANPLDYNEANPPSPGAQQAGVDTGGKLLCDQIPACKSADSAKQAKLINQYNLVQHGFVDGSNYVSGVLGSGLFLDGAGNHLELPITFNDPSADTSTTKAPQEFSLSAWFYNEGDARSSSGQVLFSHNSQASELTRFGLMVMQNVGDFDLVFFEGDVTNPSLAKTVIRSGLPNRVWLHVALTVDKDGHVKVYVTTPSDATNPGDNQNGTSLTLATSPSLACPVIDGNGVAVHDVGAIDNAVPPQGIFYASSHDNLFGLEQTDPNGLSHRTISRTGDSTTLDPDYNPSIEKLTFVSSRSGNYEVWISNPDGTNAVQVTTGFGDTARGIFARRPTWAPDGSAIVFESNAFSGADGTSRPDNLSIHGYQLYYLPCVAGVPTKTIDYQNLVDSTVVGDYRLTGGELGYQHFSVSWLRGPKDGDRGEIAFTRASADYKLAAVEHLLIPQLINSSMPALLQPFGGNDSANVRLLTARSATLPNDIKLSTRMLLSRESIDYVPATQYTLTPTSAPAGEIAYVVKFAPKAYADTCWDHDLDTVCDDEENRDKSTVNKNGKTVNECTKADCYPSSIRDLYVPYNSLVVAPRRYTAANAPNPGMIGEIVNEPGSWLSGTGHAKGLVLDDHSMTDFSYLKVDVSSDDNDIPIPDGTQLAVIRFTGPSNGNGVTITQRRVDQSLYLWTLDTPPASFEVKPVDFDEVLDAHFSPKLDTLLLSGLQNARPILARTAGLTTTQGMQQVSVGSLRTEGLDWESLVRTYPCNWVGNHRQRFTGAYQSAFRGAIDELKVYSYVRPGDAFAAEAARGFDRLVKDKKTGPQQPAVGVCQISAQCPSHQICACPGNADTCDAAKKQCRMQTCDAADPYACKEGTCTLLPIPLSDGASEAKWVCSVECSADSQCFEQECANGPCRFCSTGSTCNECRTEPKDLGGGITISYMEGCPDRNSFMCNQGTCESECYSLENGTSQYLCDPALEYCKQGRCVLNKWDWTDLAPATFSGLGGMDIEDLNHPIPHYVAHSELYPIVVYAFGMEDFGHDPEILVQGTVPAFGSTPIDLGRIVVHNKTADEAAQNSYVIDTPYPVTDVHLRLINPPYENFAGGATGLGAREQGFCTSEAWAKNSGDPTLCFRRSPASGAQLGYPTTITRLEQLVACQGLPGCASLDSGDGHKLTKYLQPGNQSVVITRIDVGSKPQLAFSKNMICSYEGQVEPVDPSGHVRSLIFGNLTGAGRESSNRARSLRSAHPNTSWPMLDLRGSSTVSDVATTMAVLNCPYALSGQAFSGISEDQRTAEAVVVLPSDGSAFPDATNNIGDKVQETANGCFVTKGPTTEPCYEWLGGEVSLDPFGAEAEPYKTLDFDTFTSFDYDACSTAGDGSTVDCSDTRSLLN